MADATQFQTMSRFQGLNNVDKPERLTPTVMNREYVYPLQQADNVEIDNTWGLSSRSGYDDILSGTDIHSLWSDNTTCLFVDGGNLEKLRTDHTTVTLKSPVTLRARMSYAPFNDRIYFTNKNEIGYVLGDSTVDLVDPGIEFKHPLLSGQLIEYYRGRMYVARGNVLYISDPLCDYFDVRHGYKLFAGEIVLLRAVDDGLYVGDEKMWWVRGDSPDEFDRKEVYSHPAIRYTDVRVNGQNVGDGVQGNVAIWTSVTGICMGDNSGTVVNLTDARYTFTPSGRGSGFIRENDNVRHYINSLY
jgi:hypothetical protein